MSSDGLMIDHGILINAAGERYIDEANIASERIREIWPEMDVTIFKHHKDGRPVQMYRMQGLRRTPYELTLSLDTDIWMEYPVPELFEVLDQFDCAIPISEIRNVYPLDVPICFYDFCPGVFAYRWSDELKRCLEDWERRFWEHHQRMDGKSHPEIGWFHSQPSFTEALYHSDLRIAPLGQEYNWTGTGYVHKSVKLVHKRPDADGEAKRINQAADKPRTALLFDGIRVWH